MKKKNKTILKLVFLTVIITTIIPIVQGEQTRLTTLDYEENDVVFIQGNVSLEFNHSDTGNEDVVLMWRTYNSDNNISIFYIVSTTISYDSSFVNNTKNYYYHTLDNSSNLTYVVKVNYSSINVPTSEVDVLKEQITQQNLTIEIQKEIISDLRNNLSSLKEQYNLSVLKENELEQKINDLKNQRDNALAENAPLQMEIENLEEQLSFQQNKSKELNDQINNKKAFINNLEGTVNQLSNPWCTGYSYHGKQQGFYFNFSSIIIGIIFGLIIIVSVEKILEYFGIKIRLKKKKALGSFCSKDKADDFSADVEEELPFSDPDGLKKLREAEKEIIKPESNKKTEGKKETQTEEKPEEKTPDKKDSLNYLDIEKEVDNIISNHTKNEVDYIR